MIAEMSSAGLELIQARLMVLVSRELDVPVSRLGLDRSLIHYGLCPVGTYILAGTIESVFGITVSPATLWARPTIAALADVVYDALVPRARDRLANEMAA